METIRGKTSLSLDGNGFIDRLARYNHITLDLGTGDGRFVRSLAEKYPERFVVGVDACRENLQKHSLTKLPNMLFVIASAQGLPCEFEGLFSRITINFPWGSLLDALLTCDAGLLQGLASVSRPAAQLEIRVNGGAMMEAGMELEVGARIICENLCQNGWKIKVPNPVGRDVLSKFPTTWARRLAHGRDPRAILLSGRRT